jgi:ribosome-binding protein aMBF1 (putative translation factor)
MKTHKKHCATCGKEIITHDARIRYCRTCQRFRRKFKVKEKYSGQKKISRS